MSGILSMKPCVVGMHEVIVQRGVEVPSYRCMLAMTAKAAIEEAGLGKSDIDGVIITTTLEMPVPNEMVASVLAEYLQIVPAFVGTMPYGGMCSGGIVHQAAAAIQIGQATTVLCISVDNMLARLGRDGYVAKMAEGSDVEWEAPFGLTVPSFFALMAQRHMFEYGTTSSQLAAVAVAARKHASMNPDALFREPITIEDVLNSRIIASPLHRLDVSLASDGGAAVVVTTGERAKNCRKAPVYLLGVGEVCGQQHIGQAPDVTTFPSARMAAERALQMAGVRQKDIDAVELYDPTTIAPVILLEELGFCAKGEGGSFVEGGRVELGGELPLNTHGGLLSCSHPGLPGSLLNVTEAARQLRGEGGQRQVPGAELILTHGEGGYLSNNCIMVFGKG